MKRPPLSAKKNLTNTAMSWAEDAECKDTPIELWFSDFGDHFDDSALRICRRCPVREKCRDYAIDNDLTDGIWGGMTPKQRHTYSRRTKGRR